MHTCRNQHELNHHQHDDNQHLVSNKHAMSFTSNDAMAHPNATGGLDRPLGPC